MPVRVLHKVHHSIVILVPDTALGAGTSTSTGTGTSSVVGALMETAIATVGLLARPELDRVTLVAVTGDASGRPRAAAALERLAGQLAAAVEKSRGGSSAPGGATAGGGKGAGAFKVDAVVAVSGFGL